MMQKKLTFNEPEIELETFPLVKELRKKIEELEDQNRRLAYENLTLRDDEMYFEKRFYESVVTYENAMNQLQKYIAEMDSNKSNRYVIVDPDAIDLEMKMTNVTEERDVAIEQLRGVCSACKHYTPYHNDGLCATCTHERACYKPWEATDKWEWKGLTEDENKEEN